MKKTMIVMLSLMSLVGASFAGASESMSEIGAQKAIKAETIARMQESLVRHEGMTKQEILADLQAQIDANVATFNAKGIAVDSKQIVEQLSALDKDGLVAMEAQQLQSVMTSANLVMKLTRLVATSWQDDIRNQNYGVGNAKIFLFPVAFVLDIALLPAEIVVTALTGF